jgi:phosphatidylserine decarboxylase
MRIHKEGFFIIPLTFFLVGGVCAAVWYATAGTPLYWLLFPVLLLGAVFFGLIVNFFRHPVFEVPRDARTIIAPANGKVVVIEAVNDPVYFKRKVTQISIFMSPLDVHVNWMPVGGKLKSVKYYPGKYLVAWHPKSSTDNEQTYLVAEGPFGEVGFKQIAGALARRIRWYVKEGDVLQQGDEFGFIRFGSRVDILVPDEIEVCVALNEVVKGGRTVIARYPG